MLAVFTNDQGLVLVAERVTPPGAWQFPQGGIEAGEEPEAAVLREMQEELGCSPADVEIVKRSTEAVNYHFPVGGTGPLTKKFKGQAQIWFHLRFKHGAKPDLTKASDKEFAAVEWVTTTEAMRRIVDFKKDAYRRGFAELGFRVQD